MSQGQGGGRPRKFKDAEELYNIGINYINERIEKKEHLTITGLCIELGTYRECLLDYESGKYDDDDNKFSDTVKRLKAHCENYAENKIYGNNPTGAIFALKNYGWKDKTELDLGNKDNQPFQVSNLSDADIDAYLEAEILKRGYKKPE
jgi:hypothetical protein